MCRHLVDIFVFVGYKCQDGMIRFVKRDKFVLIRFIKCDELDLIRFIKCDTILAEQRSARAEIEFLVQGESGVYPLEAKAETNLRAASLKSYFDRYAPSFELRVSMQKRSSGVRIEDIPLYGIPAILPLIRNGRS